MYLSFLMILSLSASHALIIPSRGITIVGVVMGWDSDMGWTWFFVISLEFFMVTILFSSSSNFCLSCSILVCNNTSANGIIKVNNNQASIILIDEVLGNLGKDQKGQYENVLNQGLLNSMDRTLRALVKFESSNPGLPYFRE